MRELFSLPDEGALIRDLCRITGMPADELLEVDEDDIAPIDDLTLELATGSSAEISGDMTADGETATIRLSTAVAPGSLQGLCGLTWVF